MQDVNDLGIWPFHGPPSAGRAFPDTDLDLRLLAQIDDAFRNLWNPLLRPGLRSQAGELPADRP